MKGYILAGLLAISSLSASAATIELQNNSEFKIREVYLGLNGAFDPSWGGIPARGGSRRVTGLKSGYYDILVYDEDGDRCLWTDIPVFGRKDYWFNTRDLLDCQNNTRQ